jgi:menaquinone-dependent protoporphyrinogen oxidase
MSSKVLVGYATRYGSTQEVASAIAETLRETGFEVTIHPLRDVRTLDGYQAVVMGAPLFMFRWHKHALGFLSRHRKALTSIPLAIFALGPTHAPHDEQEWLDAHSQLDKELAKISWLKPAAIKIFGGKYAPTNLRFPLKMFAGAEPASDIRDWKMIRAWAAELKPVLASKE